MTNEELRALRDQLYAPFPIEAHLIREGHKNKAKTKIQWFVYLDRAAIQQRLDDILPLQWSFELKEVSRGMGYVTVTAAISINGITRTFNGGQSGYNADTPLDADLEKGAFTEAFRRVASMWGCGLYLYAMDQAIWTPTYADNNWDDRDKKQGEAWKQFETWYGRSFGGARPAPQPQQVDKPATPKATNGAPTATAKLTREQWAHLQAEYGSDLVRAGLKVEKGSDWQGTYDQAVTAILAVNVPF